MAKKELSPHWLTTEQFMRTCEDEIYKAVRYQVPFTVVTAKLGFMNNGCDEVMEHFVETGLRQIDFAGRVSPDRYALGLPFTAAKGADVVAARLRLLLIEFNPIVGTAIAQTTAHRFRCCSTAPTDRRTKGSLKHTPTAPLKTALFSRQNEHQKPGRKTGLLCVCAVNRNACICYDVVISKQHRRRLDAPSLCITGSVKGHAFRPYRGDCFPAL
jgi:hypothetical protein